MVDDSYWAVPFTARYRFMRVSRDTGHETDQLEMLSGGTITRNSDTTVKETATVECAGALDVGADLVRVYLDAEWPDGTEQEVALGTFLPSCPSRSVRGGYSTSGVDMYGRLQELVCDLEPTVVEAGTAAVDYVAEWLEGRGLDVVADDSSYTLSTAQSYGVGLSSDVTTEAGMLNDLLDLAGFSSMSTDAVGRVVLQAYTAPASRPVSWEFTEGAGARFLREMTDERDTTDTPNRVFCVYSTDEETVVGEALDETGTDYSVDAVGRVISKGYSYTDLPEGDDGDEMQEAADAKAASLLAECQSVIHRVTMTHVYAPVGLGDVVRLSYGTGAVAGDFAVRTQEIDLGAGCTIQAEIKEV